MIIAVSVTSGSLHRFFAIDVWGTQPNLVLNLFLWMSYQMARAKKFLRGSLDLVLKLPWNVAAGVAENTLILCRGIIESACFCQEISCFKNTFFDLR